MDNLSMAAVIWKDNGGSYEFVNIISEDDIQLSTSVNDEGDNFNFAINPSILRSQAEVVFNLDQPGQIALNVYDLIGTEVMELNQYFSGGSHKISLDRNMFSSKGMYIVTLKQEDEILSKRLLVE